MSELSECFWPGLLDELSDVDVTAIGQCMDESHHSIQQLSGTVSDADFLVRGLAIITGDNPEQPQVTVAPPPGLTRAAFVEDCTRQVTALPEYDPAFQAHTQRAFAVAAEAGVQALAAVTWHVSLRIGPRARAPRMRLLFLPKCFSSVLGGELGFPDQRSQDHFALGLTAVLFANAARTLEK